MMKRLIRYKFTILAIALMSLPVSQAQSLTIPHRGDNRRPVPMPISSYKDDPFVRESDVERMDASRFSLGEDGRPILSNDRVSIVNESKIFRKDTDGVFKPFAWNPWPQ